MSHAIEITDTILVPDDGLLIGNGDLSVSVYQKSDALIFRFGKGDVWDRRLDLSDYPKPPHVDEIRRGLVEEGWTISKAADGTRTVTATKREPCDAKRMREICLGKKEDSDANARRPFPCPKPVGELALHLPIDLTGLKIRQKLTIEMGVLDIAITSDAGVTIDLECFVPPSPNVLVVNWKHAGWDHARTVSPGRPVVWWSLYRWNDPSIEDYAANFMAVTGDMGYLGSAGPKATPLDPPACGEEGGQHFVEQKFGPDPTFPNGFAYRLVPLCDHYVTSPLKPHPPNEARLRIWPKVWERQDGIMAVAVPTTRDTGGEAAEMRRVVSQFAADPAKTIGGWRRDALDSAAKFWSRSAVVCSDKLIENTWYETLHARRATVRPGTMPPALLMPSSLRDYSPWHGDYHTNYNIQSPFWGDYTANHVEDMADAFFDIMDYFLHVGRHIARDYFGCRGAYITLAAYPMLTMEDVAPVYPMGRMAYMNGWVCNHYWWRYLYSRDREWLRTRGYPAMRELALFYTDFLQRAPGSPDGLFHAFPSNQGEDGFPTKPEDCTDRPQVMRHIRYCLRSTVAAAEILGVDDDLRREWRERLDHAAPDNPPLDLSVGHLTQELFDRLPPEFFSPDGGPNPVADPKHLEFRFNNDPTKPSPWADRHRTAGSAETDYAWRLWQWYFGKVPWYLMICLRNGVFFADRDWPHVRELIARWRRPNGLHTAMGAGSFGHIGGWTEQLGLIAPLQEMMLQSWKGYIELFPAWPHDTDGEFTTLRAEGAFLVSAAWKNGGVANATIHSERGGRCSFRVPWTKNARVVDNRGAAVSVQLANNIASFESHENATYQISSSI